MPNVMAALSNTVGALCSTPQSLTEAHTRVPCIRCQDAKPVEICWGAQTPERMSAVSEPKFTILWEHVGETAV